MIFFIIVIVNLIKLIWLALKNWSEFAMGSLMAKKKHIKNIEM